MIQKPWLLLASVVVIFGVLASAAPRAEALCPYPAPFSSINDPYEFMLASLGSLALAKLAESEANSDSNNLGVLVYHLKSARSNYECATTWIEGFRSSTDSMISHVAQLYYMSYNLIFQFSSVPTFDD